MTDEKSPTGLTGSAEKQKENVLEFKKDNEIKDAITDTREEALIKLKHTNAFTLIYLDDEGLPSSIYSHSNISHLSSRGMINFSEHLNKKIAEDLNKAVGL